MTTPITPETIITDTIPETERLLAADTNISYAQAKARAIAAAKYHAYGYEIASADIATIDASRLVAYLALRDGILSLAIDWMSNKAQLSGSDQGVSISYYDRVAALQKTLEHIEAWLDSHAVALISGLAASATDDLPDINIRHEAYRESPYWAGDDPWLAAQWRQR